VVEVKISFPYTKKGKMAEKLLLRLRDTNRIYDREEEVARLLAGYDLTTPVGREEDFKSWAVYEDYELVPVLLILEKEGKDLGPWNNIIHRLLFTDKYVYPNSLMNLVAWSQSFRKAVMDPSITKMLLDKDYGEINWKNLPILCSYHDRNDNYKRHELLDTFSIVKAREEEFKKSKYLINRPEINNIILNMSSYGNRQREYAFQLFPQFFCHMALDEGETLYKWVLKNHRTELVDFISHRKDLLDDDKVLSRLSSDIPEIFQTKDGFMRLLKRVTSSIGGADVDINRIAKKIGLRTIEKWLEEGGDISISFTGEVLPKFLQEILSKNVTLVGKYIIPDLSLSYPWVKLVIERYFADDAEKFASLFIRDFASFELAKKYIKSSSYESSLWRTLTKASIDQGCALTGSTSFVEFIESLDKKLFKDLRYGTTEFEKGQEYVSWILEYYKDIPDMIKHSEEYGGDELDALYMYAKSSAVFNEAFKTTSFTSTQRTLTQSRRRPNQVQERFILIMDQMFKSAKRTSRDMYCWRGIAVPDFKDMDPNLDIYKSLSLSRDVSLSYLRNQTCCLMRVHVPEGMPLIAVDPVQNWKMEGGLFEFVLPRAAQFKLVGTLPAIGDDFVVYDMIVTMSEELERNLYVGRLRPLKRRKDEEDEDEDIEQLDSLETFLQRGKYAIQDMGLQPNANVICTSLTRGFIRMVKEWRASQFANNVHVDDDVLETELPRILIKFAEDCIAHAGAEVETIRDEIIENLSQYSGEELLNSSKTLIIKRARR
jgi:hypothetical protein